MVEPRSLDNSCDPRLSGSGIGQTKSELLHELARLSGPSVAYPRASFMFRGFSVLPSISVYGIDEVQRRHYGWNSQGRRSKVDGISWSCEKELYLVPRQGCTRTPVRISISGSDAR